MNLLCKIRIIENKVTLCFQVAKEETENKKTYDDVFCHRVFSKKFISSEANCIRSEEIFPVVALKL